MSRADFLEAVRDMWLFISIFIAVYGGINFYFFSKIHAAYPGPEVFTALLAIFFMFAIAAPILVRVFERRGCVRLAWLAAAVGYSWMAILFWFCVLALLGDGWNLGIRCMAHFKPAVSDLRFGRSRRLRLYGVVVLAAAGWGLIEAANIRLKEVRVSTPKLARGAAPVRIVQITDIHLSPILKERTLAKIIGLINEAKPDILVCTGDLSDDAVQDREGPGGNARDREGADGQIRLPRESRVLHRLEEQPELLPDSRTEDSARRIRRRRAGADRRRG